MLLLSSFDELVNLLRSSARSHIHGNSRLASISEYFLPINLSFRPCSCNRGCEVKFIALSSRSGRASSVGLNISHQLARWSNCQLLLASRVLSVLTNLSLPSVVYLQTTLSIANIQTDICASHLFLCLKSKISLFSPLLDSNWSCSIHHKLIDWSRFLCCCSVSHKVRS